MLDEGPLSNCALNDSEVIDINCMVDSFILPSGSWDIQKLRSCHPKSVCSKIMGVHIPRHEDFSDGVVWKPASYGYFPLKSAHASIAYNESHLPNQNF